MIKNITVAIDFPDDFIPPEKYDDDWLLSKCYRCPFFVTYDDNCYTDCKLPDLNTKGDNCPIKKYFN